MSRKNQQSKCETTLPKIGVYICHCGANIAPKVDVEAVAQYAGTLQHVHQATDYKFMCSHPGQMQIINDIKEQGVDRVVVASCSPRMHEPTFRRACESAGINPFYFHMANIREQVSWVTLDSEEATAKAKSLVGAAVARVANHWPLYTRSVPVTKSVLVIGGGIAGIQASITAGNAGYRVYLVEREPSIGGHMAKFDKTFPSLDCAACIMTPKMVEAASHPKIELLTYAEVEEVDGYIGNFKVKVRQKQSYVDWDKCTGCGACAQACPVKTPNAFNDNMDQRGAAYIQFEQAVPQKAVVDMASCMNCAGRKIGKAPKISKKTGKPILAPCEKSCPAGAIDRSQNYASEGSVRFLDVGAVILATGFSPFDPSCIEQYGYGIYSEVYTSVEFERINNATGPTSGQILMKNGLPPKRVAIVHCVGSRDERYRRYCSRVCCMYSMKFAHLIREKTQAEVWEFYIDIRSAGKRYEEFYNRVQEEGVHLVRGKVAEITDMVDRPEDEGRLTVVAENTLIRKVLRLPVDMVILSVGLEPAKGAAELSRITGVAGDSDGWFNELHVKLAPVHTPKKGLFLAGCCQGPKDIPDTVAQATAAAGEAVALLSKGTVDTLAEIASIDEELCSGCKTCISGCEYDAITFDASTRISSVNDALCQGCGNCASVCPSSAARVGQFTDSQVMSEIENLLG